MKIGRTILALIGLAAIATTYSTGNLYFLAIAIIVFFVGLVVMGAIGRPSSKRDDVQKKQQEQKKKKPRTGEPY